MIDGSFIQDQNTDSVPSKRRNPIISDLFCRMNYMERRGSGFRKIKDSYHNAPNFKTELEPKFTSSSSSFIVTLYNLNYHSDSATQLVESKKTSIASASPSIDSEKTSIASVNPSIDSEKTSIGPETPSFESRKTSVDTVTPSIDGQELTHDLIQELCVQAHVKKAMQTRILILFDHYGTDGIFGRSEIMTVCSISVTTSGQLLKVMRGIHVLLPQKGFGKGKYRFHGSLDASEERSSH